MTKTQLRAEIDRLNAENTTLLARCNTYESREATFLTDHKKLTTLRKKLQDMQTVLMRYEEMFNINSNWNHMTYSVTNLSYDYASNPIHMIVEFDVVPAPIPEEDHNNETI